MYWKDIRQEARTRTWNEFQSRLRTSLTLSALALFVACAALLLMNVTIPITLVVGFGAAVIANLMYLGGRWCNQLVKIPVERHERQKEIIEEKDQKIAELSPTVRPYSELQLTKLARLKQEGHSLLEHHITPNQSDALQQVETCINKHRRWRGEILEILKEQDAIVFVALIPFSNTNFQIPGLTAPYNLDHARLRIELFSEIGRLEEILIRAHRSGA